MEKINYTFIIPHKNIPDLLQRCLNSIPRRDDIQIIVVDDKSDPDKVDFEHFPGIGEPCVEVYFTKEGKGAGYARNVGLKHAKGKWLLFADADDYFLSNVLIILDKYMYSNNSIIYFAVESRYSDTNELSSRDKYFNALLFDTNLNDEYSIKNLKYRYIVPWGKMVSSKLILDNHLYFDEIPYGNDVMFSVYAAFFSQSISVDMSKIYCITERRESLTKQRTWKSFCVRYIVLLRRNKFLQSIGDDIYCYRVFPWFLFCLRQYGFICFCKLVRLSINYNTSIIRDFKYYIENGKLFKFIRWKQVLRDKSI